MKTAALTLCALCAIYSCGGNGSPGAQGPASPVRATAEPQKCTVGDPIEYRIVISGLGGDDVEVSLPERGAVYPEEKGPADDIGAGSGTVREKAKTPGRAPLYVVRDASYGKEMKDGVEARTAVVTLAYFRPGSFELPPLAIRGRDGVRVGYALPKITIEPVNPRKEFQEIEPPREFGGSYSRMIALAACALVALMAGIFALRRFRRGTPVYQAEIVPVVPLDAFLEELAAFRSSLRAEDGRAREQADLIHGALRRFVRAQCGIDAMEMTGAELVRALGHGTGSVLREEESAMLARCIDLWELSKFAGFNPPPGALERSLDEAETIARAIAGRRRRVRT